MTSGGSARTSELTIKREPGLSLQKVNYAIIVRILTKQLAMSSTVTAEFQTYMCLICGFIYDEAAGLPEEGIVPGTRWADVPPNWTCPECSARKDDFEMVRI